MTSFYCKRTTGRYLNGHTYRWDGVPPVDAIGAIRAGFLVLVQDVVVEPKKRGRPKKQVDFPDIKTFDEQMDERRGEAGF